MAKKEVESRIGTYLTPLSGDPTAACDNFIAYVQEGILTPKDILTPIKEPFKQNDPVLHFKGLALLDRLFLRGMLMKEERAGIDVLVHSTVVMFVAFSFVSPTPFLGNAKPTYGEGGGRNYSRNQASA